MPAVVCESGGTWVVLCWLLLWCGSAEVVMRRILLPVCLQDGLEGRSFCGCVLRRCGWRYVGISSVPFETSGRDEISLFGWRCGRNVVVHRPDAVRRGLCGW